MILGDTFKNKSIVGSEFVATVKELGPTIGTYDTGNQKADWLFIRWILKIQKTIFMDENVLWNTFVFSVMVNVRGRAYISGFNRLVVEPDDPFPEGFTVGDIWS